LAKIKKIEVKGFKSLGDKTVSVQLEEGFTTITGPNGGGKSNFMDSIIFCLGQNSPKMLRVNRLASLIYDGGDNVRNPPTTRVSVSFDNIDRTIPVDSDLVTVTRELEKSGESTYYLNGKRTARGVLLEILNLGLITSEGFNIVPQGMVMKISEMLPDEKRKLIEEIAGVSQFDSKKSEAIKQLHEADNRLQIAMARMGEIKKRVYDLEAERNDQLRLKMLEKEIRWLQSILISKKLEIVRKRKADEEKNSVEANKRLQELQKRFDENNKLISIAENEKIKFVESVVDGASGRLIELQSRINNMSYEVTKLNEERIKADNRIIELEKDIPKTIEDIEKLNVDSNKIKESVKEKSELFEDLEKCKIKSDQELQILHKERERKQTKINISNSGIDSLRNKQHRLTKVLTRLDSTLKLIEDKKRLVDERLEDMKERSKSFLDTFNNLENTLKELDKIQISEEQSLNKIEDESGKILDRGNKLKDEITTSLSVLDRAGNAIVKFEAQKEMAEKISSEEFGVSKILLAAKDGGIDGVLGRIRDLIKYEKKYEPAVLAAVGSWIDALVVYDLKTMLKVAQFAKKLKIKRLMIIPISEIKGSTKITPKTQTVKRIIGHLSEYVKTRDDISDLINFILGDVYLVRTPTDAFQTSQDGLRAVTLKGYLFEPKGKAFTLGFTAKLESISSIVKNSESIRTVKDALSSLNSLMLRRKNDLIQLDKQLRDLSKDKTNKRVTIEKMKLEGVNISKSLVRYQKLREKIGKKLEKLTKEPKVLQKKHDKLAAAISTTQRNYNKLDQKINEDDLGALSESVRKINENIDAHQESVEITTSKIRELLTDLAKQKGEYEHNVNPQLKLLNKRKEDWGNELEEKKLSTTEKRMKIDNISKNLETLRVEENDLLGQSKKSRPKIEEYDSRIRHKRSQESALRRSMGVVEKERFVADRNIETQLESQKKYVGELSFYGYSEPINYFEGCEEVLKNLNSDFDSLSSSVNLLADSRYREVYTGYKNLSVRRNQLEGERGKIIQFIESVETEKKKVFLDTFERIDKEIRIVFSNITRGSAWLEIENPQEIFNSGVFLMTHFPNNIPRESSAVSGGEKTVSAVSFILAIQSVYPSPFYLFDEIDAHLDAVNSERLANLLKERAARSQIIAISLRDSIVSKGSVVYGVYKTKGVSQVIRYRPGLEAPIKNVSR